MLNQAYVFPDDDVLSLEGARLNHTIARQLGYRQGHELSLKDGLEEAWFVCSVDRKDSEPIHLHSIDFATDPLLALSLPIPSATTCCEDWIHVEMGPQLRWIIRLIRFSRERRKKPWRSKELYLVEQDQEPIPFATAYGRAWLLSIYTWPPHHRSHDVSNKGAA